MLKPWQYLLGGVVLAVLLVPLFMQYQTQTGALEEAEPPESKLDRVFGSITNSLTGEDKIVIRCDNRWTGTIKYRTVEKMIQRAISGRGDKVFTVTGELQHVFIQAWYIGPDKPNYMEVEIWVNGSQVYSKSGFNHSWVPDPS